MHLAFIGRASWRVADAAVDAGWPATIAVAVAGITLGFFGWYALALRPAHGPLFREIALLVAIPIAVIVTFSVWERYARMLARRASIPYIHALRIDAIAWCAVPLLWLTLAAPLSAALDGKLIGIACALFALAKLGAAARYNQTVRDVAVTFIVTRIAIIVIAELAAVTIGQRPGEHFAASSNPALAVWGRWDAEHYLHIAQTGYAGTEVAFFPLYPFLIRLLSALIGNPLLAGLVISNIASFFGLLYCYRLVEHQYSRPVAQRATFSPPLSSSRRFTPNRSSFSSPSHRSTTSGNAGGWPRDASASWRRSPGSKAYYS